MSRYIRLKMQVNKERFLNCAQRLGYSTIENRVTGNGLYRPIEVHDNGYLSYDDMNVKQVAEIMGEYVADTYGGRVEKVNDEIFVYV